MDEARLSRFPHLTWFRIAVEAKQKGVQTNFFVGHCHAVALELRAERPHDVTWICGGVERHFQSSVGSVHFTPADDEQHTYITRHVSFTQKILLIPKRHIEACLLSEEHESRFEWKRNLAPHDTALRDAFTRVCAAIERADLGLDARADEAARRLVLRLAELCGGGTPDWHDDASVFDSRTLHHLVEHIDGHLVLTPSLSDMGTRVGMSPSHFARKFRQSTGLSLHRFVNRRRIHASLESLKEQSEPLAHIALELGFSSQAHFTHVFSGLTGMTPAKYRKHFRRIVG